MPRFIDRTGQRYGRLLVISRAPNIGMFTAWLCLCDCGKETVVQAGHLQQGRIVSCGCWKNENSKIRATVHGQWGTKLHRVWLSMRQRCLNPNNMNFPRYGGRGIKICAEWNDFQTFEEWALANGYKPGLSIDRRDNDGDYSPDNCRWVTALVQGSNTRKNRWVKSPLGEMTLAQLSRQSGINYGTLLSRVQSGVPQEKLLAPVRRRKTVQ